MTDDPLERLLVRAHKDELAGLSALFGITTDRGLSDLANVLARAVRRGGSNDLANATLRHGEGRPYVELLADIARARGIDGLDPEATELAVARHFLQERWDGLDAQTREQVWRELGLDAPAPVHGAVALNRAGEKLGRSFGYALTRVVETTKSRAGLAAWTTFFLLPPGCFLRPLMPVALPLIAWWGLRPDENRMLAAVLEVARIRQTVLHRVTIGVVGSPSTGKDAGIRALFGVDSGNISPVAGSTKEVDIRRVPGSTALYLVNTPGMGDVIERVTEEARQVLDHIDVYLYMINAEGGVQAREKADYDRCVATGKPVLAIVNKVDVLRPRDKERYLADARSKLGASEADFVAVAFDPLPELSPGPIDVDRVHAWLARALADLGKDPDELPALPASVTG